MLDYSKIVGLIMFDKGLECFVNSFVDGGVQLSVVGILGYVRQKKEDIVISFEKTECRFLWNNAQRKMLQR